MRSRTLCVLAVVALVASLAGGAALASTIGVTSEDATNAQVTLPTTLTDWFVGVTPGTVWTNEKASGTAITATQINFLYPSDGSYPTFTYTDGTDPVSATNDPSCWMTYDVGYDAIFTVHVGAGPGTVTTWGYAPYDGDRLITGAFSTTAESASTYMPNNSWAKFTFDFNSDVEQDLAISIPGGYAGFGGITLSQVPEPSSLMLTALGVLGLLAYAWRKRR